jgi:hypothetical protein
METLLDKQGLRPPQDSRCGLEKVLSTEQVGSVKSVMLDQFQNAQQILFDLTANYLEPLATAYDRLDYLAGLQAESGDKYVHEKLADLYGADPVDQVISQCHLEVFERLLEIPLKAQGEELRAYLRALPGSIEENAAICLKAGQNWIPRQAPNYLKELYCSNLRVLLELLQDGKSRARPSN